MSQKVQLESAKHQPLLKKDIEYVLSHKSLLYRSFQIYLLLLIYSGHVTGISGLEATIDPTVLNGTSSRLQVTLLNTRNTSLLISWGDTYIYSYNINDTDVFNTTYLHTYKDIGIYEITIWSSNSVETKNVTLSTTVYEAISGICYNVSNSTTCSSTEFNISVETGSHFTMELRFGDNTTNVMSYNNLTASKQGFSTIVLHQYNCTGYLNWSLTIRNPGGHYEVYGNAFVQDKPTMTARSEIGATVADPQISFNHTYMNTCTDKTCSRYYGDGIIDIIYDIDEIDEGFSYTYANELKHYHFEVRCYVQESHTLYIVDPIYIEYPITDPVIELPDPSWVNLEYERNLIVPYSFKNGSNITCKSEFDGKPEIEENFYYERINYGSSNGTYNKSGVGLGQHTVDIYCYNNAGKFAFDRVTILTQKKITNLTLNPVKTYVEPDELVAFYANTTGGSPIIYVFDYSDGTNNDTTRLDRIPETRQQLQLHNYSYPGYFIPKVYAYNNHSSQEAITFLGVEYPVPFTIELAAVNVSRPEYKVVCTVSHPGGGIFDPNSTRAKWDMQSLHKVDFEEDMILLHGVPYIYEHQFDIYGDINTTVTIYNNVSSVTKSVSLRIGVAIENFYCFDINPHNHAVGIEMKFNCHVDKGSVLKYNGSFGDGDVMKESLNRTIINDWTIADDTIIKYNYSTPGYFTAEFSAVNIFNDATSSVPVFIFQPVKGLVVRSNVQHLMPSQNFTFSANVTDGSNIEFHFNFGDGSPNEVKEVKQIKGAAQQEISRPYVKSGRYEVNIIAKNNVSSESAIAVVYVENPVPSEIIVSAIDGSRPSESVVFNISHPGKSIPNPDSTIASWDYLSSNTIDFTEGMVLQQGNPYIHSRKYTAYGNFTATVTIYNNISSVTKEIPFKIGTDIIGFDCYDVNPWNHAVGVEIMFICHVDKGSDLRYNGDFGDGETMAVPYPRTQIADWTEGDDTKIKYTYNTAGTFTATFTAENVFGQFSTSVNVFIHKQVSGLSFWSPLTHLRPNQEFTFYAEITNGSYVSFEFDFADASPNETLEMKQVDGVYKLDIKHRYNAADYFKACVTARNNVSATFDCIIVGVEFPVPQSIIVTADNITRPEQLLNFTVTHNDSNLPNANSTIAKWDYINDGNVNTSYTEEMALSYGIPYKNSHNYSQTHPEIYGDLTAKVTIYNNISSVSKTVRFRIGVPTFNFNCKALNPPFEGFKEMQILLHVDKGSTVLYEVDFGDKTPIHKVGRTQIVDWTSSDDTIISHTYGNSGLYSIMCKAVGNPFVNLLTSSTDITVYQGVTGVKLNSSHLYAKVNEEIKFTVSVSGGSFVYSSVNYGDNSAVSSRTPHRLLKSSDRNLRFMHTYTSVGNYTPFASSDNELNKVGDRSSGIHILGHGVVQEIVIQQEITSIKLDVATKIVKVPDGIVNLKVENTGSEKPTDVFCLWSFPDNTSDWTYAPELMSSLPQNHQHSHKFPSNFVGNHTISVTCSNQVSNASAQIDIQFQQAILNPSTMRKNDIIAVNGKAIFVVSTERGSHLRYDMNFKDGTSGSVAVPDSDKLEVSTQTDIEHKYIMSGNFTVTVRIYNDVSEANVKHLVVVQYPLRENGLGITFSSPIKYPPGDVVFTVKSNSNPFPDNVFLIWDFGNGEISKPEFELPLTTGKTIEKYYTYKNPLKNNMKLVMNASNLVSSIQMSADIQIMRAIEDFILQVSDGKIAKETGGIVSINATVKYGSNVMYSVDMGDNSGLLNNKIIGDDNTHIFQHKYNKPGNYSVYGFASNTVSSKSYSMGLIVIQNKVEPSNLKIKCSDYVGMDKDTGKGDFTVRISYINVEPTTVHFTLDAGNGDKLSQLITKWPFEYTYNYTYKSNMNINPSVTATLYNMVSNYSTVCTPQIQEKLSGLNVKSPNYTLEGQVVEIEIYLTFGSFFSAEINYGDGGSSSVVKYPNSTRYLSVNHIYKTQGTFTLTVTCKNDVTLMPLTASGNIIVQYPMPDIKVSSRSNTAITPNDKYELIVETVDSNSVIPDDSLIRIDFGDGSLPIIEKLSSTKRYTKLHKYSMSGAFVIKVYVSNEVSSESITHIVKADIPIKDFKLTVEEAIGGKILGSSDTIPLGKEIVFSVSITEGTNVTYKWLLDKEKFTGSSFKHTFQLPGVVKLLANASNSVSMIVGTRELKVFSNSEIDSFSYNTTVIVPAVVEFEIVLKKAPANICFQIELKSDSLPDIKLWVGTTEKLCQNRITDFDINNFTLSTSKTVFTQNYKAVSQGFYEVILTMISENSENDVVLTDKDKKIEVQGKQCDSPVITLIGSLGAKDKPITFRRASQVNAPNKGYSAIINCQATEVTVIEWQMYIVESNQEVPVNYTDYSGTIFPDRLQFPALILPYGLYHFKISISMEGLPHKSHSAEFYLEIISSKLVTALPTSMRLGNKQTFTLSGEDSTYDPDVGRDNKEGITYTWFCGMMDSKDGEFECPADVKCEEGLDETYIASTDVSKLNLITIPGSGDEKVKDWKSGCFGDGFGRLDTTSGVLTLETNKMESARWYRIVLRVNKGKRFNFATTNIEVIPGAPPVMKAQCYDDNMMIKVCGRNYAGASELYQIFVNCESCTKEELDQSRLQYEVTETTPGSRKRRNANDIKDKIVIYNHNGGKLFQIPKGSFTPGSVTEFKFTLSIPELQKGKLNYKIEVNGKPSKGTFDIQPREGKAMATEIEMIASGWEMFDPDGMLNYQYESCTRYKDPEGPQNCVTKFLPKTMMNEGLEENDFNIGVRLIVCDDYSTCTTTEFILVKMTKAADNAADDALAGVLQESNPTSVFDVIVTVTANIEEKNNTELSTNDVSSNAPSDSAAASTGNNGATGGSENYDKMTAEQRAEAEAIKQAEIEKKKQEQNRLATAITAIVSMTVSATGESSQMSPEQKLQALQVMASLTKKVTKDISMDATKGSLAFISSMASDLNNMDANKKSSAINGLLNIAGNLGYILEKDVVVNVEAPVDLDTVLNEAELEKLKLLESQQKETGKNEALNAMQVIESTGKKIIEVARLNMQVDGEIMKFGTAAMELIAHLASSSTMSNKTYNNPEFNTTIPVLPYIQEAIFLQMLYMPTNILSFEDSAAAVTTGVTKLTLVDTKNKILDIELGAYNPITFTHNVYGENNWADTNNLTVDSLSKLRYYHVGVDINQTGYISCLHPVVEDISFAVYVKFNVSSTSTLKPNKTDGEYDYKDTAIQSGEIFCFIIPQSEIFVPGFYVGIDVIEEGQTLENAQLNYSLNPFKMNSVLSRCRSWDDTILKWTADKCSIGKRSSLRTTECECTELSKRVQSYAGGVSLPQVNTINFANVFANFSALLMANPTVFATIMSILALYVFIGIWTRRMDRRDIEKWGVAPLVDNKVTATHFYKISVFTGMRRGAGTRSKVCFILSGEYGDTGVRIADDGVGKWFLTSKMIIFLATYLHWFLILLKSNYTYFTRGSVRHFVMGTEYDMGAPTFLRIWHDNSGKDDKASWFLDKVVIENINTKTRYFFFCSRWLAAEEDDGQVDRIVPVAGKEELEDFNNLFFNKARKKLTDDHLWVSVASRPTRSTFTRFQRLSCCMSLLFLTMIVNAMFFRSEPEVAEDGQQPDTKINLGPIILSVNSLLVSIFGALIVLPINIAIVQIFRKSKPKNWKEVDENEMDNIRQQTRKYLSGEVNNKEGNGDEEDPDQKAKKKKIWKKKYPLPYQGIYVAWTLAILSIVLSAFFIILYSLDWGETKSLEWLSSFVFSVCQSIAVIQPLKIVFVAAILSVIFKNFDEVDDDEHTNKQTNIKPEPDEEFIDIMKLEQAPIAYIPKPPSKRRLELARQNRIFEKKIWDSIKEIIYYVLFMILIGVIAWGPRRDYFNVNKHVKATINTQINNDFIHGDKVLTGHDFWNWLQDTVMPSVFYHTNYNGKPTTVRDRKFMSDMLTYRVGSMRLRQSRVIPGSCEILKQMKGIIAECNDPYGMNIEETRNFSVGWHIKSNNSIINEENLTPLQKSYLYYSIFTLKNLPHWGKMGTYGGGGYVVDLGTSKYQAEKILKQLKENDWINYYTRAVFLEFTVYNPNTNLFSFVNYLMEFPATGAVLASERVSSFQVYNDLSGSTAGAVVAAQLMYCVAIIYFIVAEIIKIKNEKKEYWRVPWNYLEVANIICSVAAIAMYVLREKFGRMVQNQLKADKESYTNYMALALYNENIEYFVAFIVFFANLKLLRLLRFNQHIAEFSSTLKHAVTELCYFALTFFLMFMGFGMWGHIVFGKNLFTFATFISTLETMFSMLLGKFDMYEIEAELDSYMGKMFIITYTYLVFFVLVTMFVAIIDTAYAEVRQLPKDPYADYKVIDFVVKKIQKLLHLKYATSSDSEVSDNYIDLQDMVHMRLSLLDQHINHMCNEILETMRTTKTSQGPDNNKPEEPKKNSFFQKFKWNKKKDNKEEKYTKKGDGSFFKDMFFM